MRASIVAQMLAPALAIIAIVAARADACPIELAGDPAATNAIAGELAAFGNDAGPCLALEVQCRIVDGAIAIDLRDELDGRATRTFESPAGAAAFLISWSRRPLAVGERAVAPQAPPPTPPTATPPTATPPRDTTWRNELALAGILTTTNRIGAVQGLRTRTANGREFGVGVRALVGEERNDYEDTEGNEHFAGTTYLGLQALALYGFTTAPTAWSRVHGHVEGGATFLSQLDQSQISMSGAGPHLGVHVGAALQIGDELELELGLGVDLLLQRTLDVARNPLGPSNVYGFGHLHAIFRWLP